MSIQAETVREAIAKLTEAIPPLETDGSGLCIVRPLLADGLPYLYTEGRRARGLGAWELRTYIKAPDATLEEAGAAIAYLSRLAELVDLKGRIDALIGGQTWAEFGEPEAGK